MNKRIVSVIICVLLLLSASFGVSVYAQAKGVEINNAVLLASKVKKPAKVKKLKLDVKCNSVTFKWKKQKKAKGYQVFVSTSKNGKYKRLATVKKNTYTAKKVKAGNTYYYKVRAFSKKKKKKLYGAFSAVKKAEPAHAPSSSWTIVKKASCVQEGVKRNKCIYCKKYYTVKGEKDMTTHIYEASTVDATEKYESYKVYKCKVCGDTYTSKIKEHKYETKEVKPTCKEQGYTIHKCSKCDYEYKSDYTDVLPHEYEEKIIREATCTETGEAEKVCKLCGDKSPDSPYQTDMIPHDYETKTVPSNCTDDGYFIDVCKACGYENSDSIVINKDDPAAGIEHSYETKSVEATCIEGAYDIQVCTICGFTDEKSKTYTSEPLPHTFEAKTVEPTCTEGGYTEDVCTECGTVKEDSKRDETEPLGHEYSLDYVTDEDGFRRYYCVRCDDYQLDTTCYIDIKKETVSNPKYAVFNKSSTNTTDVNDKLDLTPHPDGIVDFEITGSRENLTIDINATAKAEVKLAGVSITNNGRDCINIKDKAADTVDENGTTVHNAPKVYVSAKDLSENKLITTTSGNAIDSNCPLELRGHGRLTMNTASTAIDNKAKLVIKNLTLDITSANRGIDTELETEVAGLNGETAIIEDYFNIEIEPKANITIKSADDCIRCKNMEILALDAGAPASDATVMNLTSTFEGDGIQLKGNKGFVANSGIISITVNSTASKTKYMFNCKASLVTINPPAKVTTSGTAAYAEPDA